MVAALPVELRPLAALAQLGARGGGGVHGLCDGALHGQREEPRRRELRRAAVFLLDAFEGQILAVGGEIRGVVRPDAGQRVVELQVDRFVETAEAPDRALLRGEEDALGAGIVVLLKMLDDLAIFVADLDAAALDLDAALLAAGNLEVAGVFWELVARLEDRGPAETPHARLEGEGHAGGRNDVEAFALAFPARVGEVGVEEIDAVLGEDVLVAVVARDGLAERDLFAGGRGDGELGRVLQATAGADDNRRLFALPPGREEGVARRGVEVAVREREVEGAVVHGGRLALGGVEPGGIRLDALGEAAVGRQVGERGHVNLLAVVVDDAAEGVDAELAVPVRHGDERDVAVAVDREVLEGHDAGVRVEAVVGRAVEVELDGRLVGLLVLAEEALLVDHAVAEGDVEEEGREELEDVAVGVAVHPAVLEDDLRRNVGKGRKVDAAARENADVAVGRRLELATLEVEGRRRVGRGREEEVVAGVVVELAVEEVVAGAGVHRVVGLDVHAAVRLAAEGVAEGHVLVHAVVAAAERHALAEVVVEDAVHHEGVAAAPGEGVLSAVRDVEVLDQGAGAAAAKAMPPVLEADFEALLAAPILADVGVVLRGVAFAHDDEVCRTGELEHVLPVPAGAIGIIVLRGGEDDDALLEENLLV